MSEEIPYPEEVKQTAYESLYLRNFNKDVKRQIQHIAIDENISMSDVINRACKLYVKSVNQKNDQL